jgi:regulator of protease activity HflC (stomatin/prohibitin superfamily)
MKTINVLKNFVLTLEDHTTRAFKKGVHVVEAEIADHWYVKANTEAVADVKSVEADAEALKAKAESEAAAEKAKAEAEAAVLVTAVEAPAKKAK